jgi:cytochrome P450
MRLNGSVESLKPTAPVTYSPWFGRSVVQHPRDLYQRLCVQAPAHRVMMWNGQQAWLVTQYAEAKAASTDPRLSRNWHQLMDLEPWGAAGPRWSMVNSYILHHDSPEHARLRRLITTEFMARCVQKIQPEIIRIADGLLDAIAASAATGARVDLMKLYAMPLPLRVISTLLGVPPSETENLRMQLEPLLTSTDAPMLGAIEYALGDLLDGLIAQKRARPEDDLLSAIVHMSDEEGRLSNDELVSTALLLILAGYDTSVHVIANGVLALLLNPSQLMTLRADPSLLDGLVEEVLRFESPLNVATTRFTTETVRIGKAKIPAGQLVFVSLPRCPNDDAGQCEFETRVSPTLPGLSDRPSPSIHRCLGAGLARLEGRVAIGLLLRRFGQITLSDNAVLRYGNRFAMPRPTTLLVRVGA